MSDALNLKRATVVPYGQNCLLEPSEFHESLLRYTLLALFDFFLEAVSRFVLCKFLGVVIFLDNSFYEISHLGSHALDIHV
jgi:hypothetical protein